MQLRNVRGVRDQFGLKSGGLRRVEAVGFWNTYKGTHRGTYKGTYKGIYKVSRSLNFDGLTPRWSSQHTALCYLVFKTL